MSSSQFVLAYACDRPDAMSDQELIIRLDAATEHLESIAPGVSRIHIGDARVGFAVWEFKDPGCRWPAAARRPDEAAAWLHVPAIAGGPEAAVDSIDLSRDITSGSVDRGQLGAPCATVYWNHSGLRIANDRMGMARLYEFAVPGFGTVWSSRQGLAHVFGGMAPRIEDSTWSEMATLGWPVHGDTHLGNGKQLRPGVIIRASNEGRVSTFSDLDGWMNSILEGSVPTIAEGAESMIHTLETLKWWRGKPSADLSGGKDSRVTAAAAIEAGVVDTVRTVNTDPGEVETVRELLRRSGDEVTHRIDEVKQPKPPEGGAYARYMSMQRGWEGAYNALSVYRAPTFTGYRPSTTPRINGLGGEALQGQTQVGKVSREKLKDQGPEVGRDHLVGLATARAEGTEESAVEAVSAAIDRFAETAVRRGMDNAYMVVDYFYHFSKMPFWAHPQGTNGTVLPLYSPHLLPRTMWSLRNHSEYGELHRSLLRNIKPSWAEVPFYKSAPGSRTVSRMWQNDDWPEIFQIVLDGVGALSTFSRDATLNIVEQVKAGKGKPKHEFVFNRIMWELTFRDYAREIEQAAARTSERVAAVRGASPVAN